MEKKESMKAVTFIIIGALLQIFNGIGNGWAVPLISIFGLVLFYIGLKKLKAGLDAPGQSAVNLLFIALIISLVGMVFVLIPIPLTGWIALIFFIIAFGVQLYGFIKLKSSETIGESGKSGAGLLVISMILMLVASIFSFIPVLGGIIAGLLSLAAFYLVFDGWLKIQTGIIGSDDSPAKSISLLLIGLILMLCNAMASGWAAVLVALFGLYLLFKGLSQLKDKLDEKGSNAINLLIISVYVGILAAILDFIASLQGLGANILDGPSTFDIIVILVFVGAYVVQFLAYLKLKESTSISETGKKGIILLMIAMIAAAIGGLIAMVPLAALIAPVFILAGIVLVFLGWVRVQEELI